MNSSSHGTSTSATQITEVLENGFWLQHANERYFLSFDKFPWFKDAPESALHAARELSPGHFYWAELDVDLGLETIKNPDRYPLIATG